MSKRCQYFPQTPLAEGKRLLSHDWHQEVKQKEVSHRVTDWRRLAKKKWREVWKKSMAQQYFLAEPKG